MYFLLTLSFWGRLLCPSQPPAKLATSLSRKEREMHKYVDLCYMIKHLIVFLHDYSYRFLLITPFFHNIQPLTRKMKKSTSSHIKIGTVIPQSPRLCCEGHACAKTMDHQLPRRLGRAIRDGTKPLRSSPTRPITQAPILPLPLSPHPCTAWKSTSLDGVQTSIHFYQLFKNGS